MALVDSAVNGLAGAVVAGLVSVVLWLAGRGRRSQRDDAWRKQAEELDERITKQNADEKRELRADLAEERAAGRRKDAEIRRLNQLLTEKRRPGDD